MTEKNKPNMPDFDRLNDRIIAEAPKGPFIGIRTNLDDKNTEKMNPYAKIEFEKN
jgi:hypothetical protein